MADEVTELSPGSDTNAATGDAEAGGSASADSTPAAASTDANTPAQSSGADKQDADKTATPSLYDAIAKAVEAKPSDTVSSDRDGKTQEATDTDTAAQAEATVEAADKDLPFHKHPRWQKQLADNKALAAEVASLKPAAEQYRMVDQFMAKTGISSDDVVEALQITALIRKDPAKAVEALTGIIINLRTATGDLIPGDLRKKVDDGEISEEAARELSTTRAQKRALEAERTQRLTADQQAKQDRDAAEFGKQIETAANEWERKAKATDLDFATKQPLIKDRIKVLMTEIGRPANSEATVALCQRAYQDVTDQLRGIRGPRMGTPNAPRSGMSAASTAKAAPKTFEEAIQRAVQRG